MTLAAKMLLAGLALTMLALPVGATERSAQGEFRCGKQFITLPVEQIGNAAGPRFVLTVRKSDVITIAAQGMINFDEGSVLAAAHIVINSVSDEEAGASREIRTFRLQGRLYDHVVACLN